MLSIGRALFRASVRQLQRGLQSPDAEQTVATAPYADGVGSLFEAAVNRRGFLAITAAGTGTSLLRSSGSPITNCPEVSGRSPASSTASCLPKTPPVRRPSGMLASYRFVTVLVYHVVDASHFGSDLDQFREWGYTTISPDDLTLFLSSNGAPRLPDRPLLLTFDDGGLSQYENAFPELRARGMTATFYVVPDWVDDLMGSEVFLEAHHYTWAQAREMFRAGMRIQAHGQHHLNYQMLGGDGSAAGADFLAAKGRIEASVAGEKVDHLAYPYGVTNPTAMASLRAAHCHSARIVRVNRLGGAYRDPNEGLFAYCTGYADSLAFPCAGAGSAGYIQQANEVGILGPDGELCVDPGFELGGIGWDLSQSRATISSAVARTGTRSLQLVGGASAVASASALANTGPFAYVECSVWIKCLGVPSRGASVTFERRDGPEARKLVSASDQIVTGGTHDWQLFTLPIWGDGEASYLRVLPRLAGGSTDSTVWFDDFSVRRSPSMGTAGQ